MLNSTMVLVCRIFQHDSFEPGLVVASFAAWHLLFYVADTKFSLHLQRWRIQNSSDMRHWKFETGKRYRTGESCCINRSCEASRATMEPDRQARIGRIRAEVQWRPRAGPSVIESDDRGMECRLRGELLTVVAVYSAPILAFDQFYPRRKLPERAPSAFRLFTEVLAALIVYDALFFLVHLALHKVLPCLPIKEGRSQLSNVFSMHVMCLRTSKCCMSKQLGPCQKVMSVEATYTSHTDLVSPTLYCRFLGCMHTATQRTTQRAFREQAKL